MTFDPVPDAQRKLRPGSLFSFFCLVLSAHERKSCFGIKQSWRQTSASSISSPLLLPPSWKWTAWNWECCIASRLFYHFIAFLSHEWTWHPPNRWPHSGPQQTSRFPYRQSKHLSQCQRVYSHDMLLILMFVWIRTYRSWKNEGNNDYLSLNDRDCSSVDRFCLHGAGVQRFLSSGMKLIMSLLSSGFWVQMQTPEMDLGIQTSTCSQLLGSWGESHVEILHEYLC